MPLTSSLCLFFLCTPPLQPWPSHVSVSQQPYLVSPPGSLHFTWNALFPPDLDYIFLSADFALFLDLPSVPTFPQAKVELGFKSLFQQIRDKWYLTTVIKNKLLPILFNWGYPKTLKQDLSGMNSNSYTWELILYNNINDSFQHYIYVLAFICCVLIFLNLLVSNVIST